MYMYSECVAVKPRTVYYVVIMLIAIVWKSRSQQTYQRSCDCEYMINGKCAYTILLPVTNGSTGTCSGSGTSLTSSFNDVILQALQHNISYLVEWSQNQSMLVSQLQGIVLTLLYNCSACVNTGCDVIVSSTLGILNVTVQRQSADIIDIKSQLLQQATTIDKLNQSYVELSNELVGLTKIVNNVVAAQTVQLSMIEQLRSLVQQHYSWTCTQRAALYSAHTTKPVISFSSIYSDNKLTNINIQFTGANGAWCPSDPNLPTEWVQFDIGSDSLVYGIVSRGRTDYPQWVTSYQVNYTAVGTTSVSNTTTWISYTDELTVPQTFTGNVNQTTPVTNYLWNPIQTRYVRIIPISSNYNGVTYANKCMRVDIIGCIN